MVAKKFVFPHLSNYFSEYRMGSYKMVINKAHSPNGEMVNACLSGQHR